MKKLKPYPIDVCSECGLKASKAMGNVPPAFEVSTFHYGICDVCGIYRPVTESRDFFYPPFVGHKKS